MISGGLESLLRRSHLGQSSQTLRLVVLESPYAGTVDVNVDYARRCIKDSLNRGEAPIASHLLYTQPGILDDLVASERSAGIRAGLAWYRVAEKCVVYTDLGVSSGMESGMARARYFDVAIELRSIDDVAKAP